VSEYRTDDPDGRLFGLLPHGDLDGVLYAPINAGDNQLLRDREEYSIDVGINPLPLVEQCRTLSREAGQVGIESG